MELKEMTLMDRKMEFAVLAIEASAERMGIDPVEMRRRLEKVGLIKRLLFDGYEPMHTQSMQQVAEDVIEALHNWEATDGCPRQQEGGDA